MGAMTGSVKDELSRLPAGKACCRRAELSAVLRFAGGLHVSAGRLVVQAELDSGLAARRLRREIADVYGQPAGVRMLSAGAGGGSPRYLVRVERHSEALARCTGLIDQAGRSVLGLPATLVTGGCCDAAAAWRGAFLAHGSLSESGRSPGLQVSSPGPEAALALVGAARRLGVLAKFKQVRGVDQVLVRDSHAIGVLLHQLGASQGGVAWQERQARRVQGTASTIANFQTANQRRSASAAATTVARVQTATTLLAGGEGAGHLLTAGRLRLQHPQASLEALGALADPPMTKDAVAGRLRRLLAQADRHAAALGLPTTQAVIGPGPLEAF